MPLIFFHRAEIHYLFAGLAGAAGHAAAISQPPYFRACQIAAFHAITPPISPFRRMLPPLAAISLLRSAITLARYAVADYAGFRCFQPHCRRHYHCIARQLFS